MAEEGMFKKSAFGGFQKENVLSYIEQMNASVAQNEKELQAKIDDLTASREELDQQVSDYKQKLSALEEQLKNEQQKIDALTRNIFELKDKVSEQNRLINEKEREVQLHMEQERQLKFKAESLEYKSVKYDEVAAELGNVLLDAKKSAAGILEEANHKAESITVKATQEARQITGEIQGFKDDIAQMREGVKKIMDTILTRLDDIEGAVDRARDTLELKKMPEEPEPKQGEGESRTQAKQGNAEPPKKGLAHFLNAANKHSLF